MMLESRKELVALESSLNSSSTKRSPFHLLSSIFSKKKQSVLDNDDLNAKQADSNLVKTHKGFSESDDVSIPSSCSFDPGISDRPKGFESPIGKSRRKNLRMELETLHLSRQDNPYLKQLERFGLPEESLLSCALLQDAWQGEDIEEDVDIHQHLVRSPPPQFPQNLSHFMYSQANSPKRQISQRTESCDDLDSGRNKKSKSLNPLQPKREAGTLDPGIREVLEYQKAQFRAGLQHSLNIGPGKLETAPTRYVPKGGRFTALDSRGILVQDRGSKPTATVSLPSYLDLEQTQKKIPLGPVRIGRTLSDSLCHDNKFRENLHKQ